MPAPKDVYRDRCLSQTSDRGLLGIDQVAPLHWVHPIQKEYDMLVLSRKLGERIVIGPNIELTIVGIRGDKVRLAVDAPRDVSIHRQEVYQRIQDECRHEAQHE